MPKAAAKAKANYLQRSTFPRRPPDRHARLVVTLIMLPPGAPVRTGLMTTVTLSPGLSEFFFQPIRPKHTRAQHLHGPLFAFALVIDDLHL